MPRGKHRVQLTAGTVMVLMLTACASPAPTPTVRATSVAPVVTPTPAFTSDADAVAAAEAFYKRYITATNSAVAAGELPSASDRPFISDELYKEEQQSERSFQAEKERPIGSVQPFKIGVQQVARARGSVILYVCLDVRKARVLDAAGKDVTPSARPAFQQLVVTVDDLLTTPVITGSKPWSGSSIC